MNPPSVFPTRELLTHEAAQELDEPPGPPWAGPPDDVVGVLCPLDVEIGRCASTVVAVRGAGRRSAAPGGAGGPAALVRGRRTGCILPA